MRAHATRHDGAVRGSGTRARAEHDRARLASHVCASASDGANDVDAQEKRSSAESDEDDATRRAKDEADKDVRERRQGAAAPEGRRRDAVPPSGFNFWIANVLQPMELLKLVGKGFLFYAAFSMTAFALSSKSMKSHPIPTRYDVFLDSAKTDKIRALHVDGNQLTWAPRARMVVSATPESVGTPFDEPREVEIVYHTSRPADAPIPYDTLLKNRVDLSAPDARNVPNFTPWIALFSLAIIISVFRNAGQGAYGSPSGVSRGGPGGLSMPGIQRGGRARDALAPPTTTFDDVAGVDEAKEELTEIVDILKNPEKYAKLGARPPSGVLLVGAPGTGKTLLARAVAGEAGVPFISISASEFVELYVGMGAARVREVFARAKAQSPAIVFIDEIDAVAKTRGDGKLRGMGNDEREQTLNQLLTELDGFETESLVICIAATNRPDSLDAALRRPGRFDRTVSVDRPDKQGRKEILAVHTKRRALPLAADAGLDVIAQMTAGFTGADLENLVNEAALLAGRAGKTNVGYSEFEAAVLRTVAGIEKKRSLLTMSEKRTVSAHEVGHALVATAVGRLLPDTERPETLSIVSRSGGALGFTYTPPTEDKSLMYKDELLGKVTMFMGGRAAEMVVCKRISSGASDDIQRATNLAYKSIAELGFSANVGPMSVSTLSAGGNEEMLIGSDKSSESDAVVEREVKHTLSTALLVACDVVRSNAEVMAELTKVLSENEKVQGAELQAFLNRVVAPPSLAAYLRGDAPPITKADIDLMSTFPLPEVLPPGVAR
jgi:cell division protease FtsH